jgi:hypothetical protein
VTVFSLAAIVTALGKERRATVFASVQDRAAKT